MTASETHESKSYRPVRRALTFGLCALGIRGITIGLRHLFAPGDTFDLDTAVRLLQALNLLGTFVALAGVGYSAIASYRGEWGVKLVAAWLFSVAAVVLTIELFVYARF